MKKEILYIVMPAYNEQETILKVINEWYPIVEKQNGVGASRLVIIDDGSRDNTYSIVEDAAKDKPLLLLLSKPNSGHGATILWGYQYAITHGADFVFQTDSDGQTNPKEFPEFWDLRHDYEMIIGNRKHREDGVLRIVVTKALKLIIHLCFGVWAVDANTPFRLMKANSLQENIQYIPDSFNLSNVMLTVIFEKRKQRIKYIPVTFKCRQGGVNSINFIKIFVIGYKALKDFVKIKQSLKQLN